MNEQERLQAALRRWSGETARITPPAEIRPAVLAEFDRVSRTRRRWHWTVTAAAAAAALTLVLYSGNGTQPTTQEAIVDDSGQAFIPLPYVVQPSPYERTEIVRMNVTVAELAAAGLPVAADPGGRVQAEVVIGQDGRARAVRVLSVE